MLRRCPLLAAVRSYSSMPNVSTQTCLQTHTLQFMAIKDCNHKVTLYVFLNDCKFFTTFIINSACYFKVISSYSLVSKITCGFCTRRVCGAADTRLDGGLPPHISLSSHISPVSGLNSRSGTASGRNCLIELLNNSLSTIHGNYV